MDRIAMFEAVMDVCDPDLSAHAGRVEAYSTAIAERLDWNDERLAELRIGAALHDIGKVNVRPELLSKPATLTEAEFAEIRAHPVEGLWLIAGVRSLAVAAPYVLFHHERWDGEGYPTRRARSDIPIEGRILAIADAFDAMISNRPYRAALSTDEALAEVERCAGTQFDPELAAAFLDAMSTVAV